MGLTKNIKKDLGAGFHMELEVESATVSVTLNVKKVVKKGDSVISTNWENPSAYSHVQITDKAILDKVKKENPSLMSEIETKIKAELDALS